MSLYYAIAGDITRNCNLRCPFCLADFQEYREKGLIEEETFDRLMTLLPLVAGEGKVLLSCLFEPSIHPRWLDLYERVPHGLRSKCFFTTNLARVEAGSFERLGGLGFHHINVSVDSLRPDVYEDLRRGARFDAFRTNLGALARHLRESESPLPLHGVTTVTRRNADEVPALVERCAEEFGFRHHEVRYVYETAHIEEEWKRANLLPQDAWEGLQAFAEETEHDVALEAPPEHYYADDGEPYSRTGPPAPKAGEGWRRIPLALRFRSDGTVKVYAKDLYFDVHAIDDPHAFFRDAAPFFLADRDLIPPEDFGPQSE
ncbi:MAG: radical SAM protein [Planctomycetota bacterium]